MLGRLIIAGFIVLVPGAASLARQAERLTTWQRDANSIRDRWIKTQIVT
jgi:hypothetical protein